MSILTVRHVTTYRYRQPVAFGEHRMMLRPREGHDQRLLDTSLVITPKPESIRWAHDVFGNSVAVARFRGRATELSFESVSRLDRSPSTTLDFHVEDYAATYPFTYSMEEMPDLARSIERHYPDPERLVDKWAARFLSNTGRTGTIEMLVAMTYAINEQLTYPPSRTRHPIRPRDAHPGERHLPRLRRADDGSGPLARPRRPLRLRLHLQPPRRPQRLLRRRLDPCLGADLPARRRLARVRPDKRAHRQP